MAGSLEGLRSGPLAARAQLLHQLPPLGRDRGQHRLVAGHPQRGAAVQNIAAHSHVQ